MSEQVLVTIHLADTNAFRRLVAFLEHTEDLAYQRADEELQDAVDDCRAALARYLAEKP